MCTETLSRHEMDRHGPASLCTKVSNTSAEDSGSQTGSLRSTNHRQGSTTSLPLTDDSFYERLCGGDGWR